MMESNSKASRTSRCREWERQRRNKFKDAIIKLGEVVKSINNNGSNLEDSENIQYPKIEIVQKAILCLTNCVQEKTQLKAEILALHVKLENKTDKRDASTQVFIKISKKLQSSKGNPMKEKSIITIHENKVNDTKVQKLPKLLPRSNLNNKKGTENTFVVLPAAPYIFPQRPVLFPTVPPAFVLVDSNLQTLNKSSIPVINRTTASDVTKTTMVNILPISAYSRPLSAIKNKKNISKPKNEINKKASKKGKEVVKKIENNNKSKDTNSSKENLPLENEESIKKNIPEKETITDSNNTKQTEKSSQSQQNPRIKQDTPNKIIPVSNIVSLIPENSSKDQTKIIEVTSKAVETSKSKSTDETISSNTKVEDKTCVILSDLSKEKESNKVPIEKDLPLDNKENKLPALLDTTLCEHNVDGGNVRLELAEEFLAASPTAAFLLSFPLVSGNRADSPAEETNSVLQSTKDTTLKRTELSSQSDGYYKHTDQKYKSTVNKTEASTTTSNKQSDQQKIAANEKVGFMPISSTVQVSTDNPFLNLPVSSLVPTSCTLPDATFGFDFDSNLNKSVTSSTTYVSNSNIFYKSDPFSTVKSTIYSTSAISSGHEFNSIGLYPCAMEKYTTKNKSDYANVDENIMKIGSSRLTYDIDLGWSHKSFDFVNCPTTSNAFNKENILSTPSVSYSTSYNPFNPDFHASLVSNSNKKECLTKTCSSFADTITSFYSQPTNLWTEEVPFYSSSNISKSLSSTKDQSIYNPTGHSQNPINQKPNTTKQYEVKPSSVTEFDSRIKSSNIGTAALHHLNDKYKKSPNKMHINWMTSEVRSLQNNYNPPNIEDKETNKVMHSHIQQLSKKQNQVDSNYFPISIQNYSSQPTQEEFQVWPSTRPLGTTEVTMEPPPINLPTLVGDLALGPHDKKKNIEMHSRSIPHNVNSTDSQNCNNFLSVTQLMNRSSDMSSRYHTSTSKPIVKQNMQFSNDISRKVTSRLDTNPTTLAQPCYVFNDVKPINSYEVSNQYSQSKSKTSKTDKTSKVQKNSYSAESLIRGGSCTQKVQENNSNKFIMPSQKYPDYSAQDSSVAQISHYPPILDYSDNTYTGQQFSGTTLYNSTTNTLSNSFYTNFMQGTSNLMSSNYASGPFPSDFTDYNQSTECNYASHKYEDLKTRNNPTTYHQDKVPSNYKSSRRESSTKHKLECSKKENSKKYHSKRTKINNEVEEWNDSSLIAWQNKATAKRHPNIMGEDLPYPNYVGNQIPSQYQPEYFNSHLISSSAQSATGQNADRPISSFPITSRANFNLSTIFPEITMKVQ